MPVQDAGLNRMANGFTESPIYLQVLDSTGQRYNLEIPTSFGLSYSNNSITTNGTYTFAIPAGKIINKVRLNTELNMASGSTVLFEEDVTPVEFTSSGDYIITELTINFVQS